MIKYSQLIYVCTFSICWFIGYYCSGGAVSPTPSGGLTGDICLVGHFCPMGSASPVTLPWWDSLKHYRYWTKSHGDIIISEIVNAGSYSFFYFFSVMKEQKRALTVPQGPTVCQEKVFSPCPAGHYCLGGGVEGILPCPPGTYSPHSGLRQVEQCLICPAGESVATCLSSALCLQDAGNVFIELRPILMQQIMMYLPGCVWNQFILMKAIIECFNRFNLLEGEYLLLWLVNCYKHFFNVLFSLQWTFSVFMLQKQGSTVRDWGLFEPTGTLSGRVLLLGRYTCMILAQLLNY